MDQFDKSKNVQNSSLKKTRLKNRYYWQFNTNFFLVVSLDVDKWTASSCVVIWLVICEFSRCLVATGLNYYLGKDADSFSMLLFSYLLLIRDRVRQDKIQKTPLSDLHRSCRQSSTNIIRVQWYLSKFFPIFNIVLNFGRIKVYLYSALQTFLNWHIQQQISVIRIY